MSTDTSNPYQAPRVRVDDSVEASLQATMPRPAKAGVVLLCASFVIEVFLGAQIFPGLLAEIQHGEEHTIVFWVAVAAAIVIVVSVSFLIAMIARGRNWARILYLAFYLIGTPSFLMSIGSAFGESLQIAIGSVASNLLQVAALVVLFLPVSNAWFRARREIRA